VILYNAGLHDGDLGGRSGADALCLAARPASLPASYTNVHAFISVQPGDAIRDLPIPFSRPIASVGGTTIFTDGADMLDGNNPTTSLLAAGVTPTNTEWWSGSNVIGNYWASRNQCNNWTNNANTEQGSFGSTDTPPSGIHWLGGGHFPCALNRYLLCITYEP
jgi:hypothetical protein